MRTLHLTDLHAHLGYHDLHGSEPACVYLHGLGTASSADFPTIARHPALVAYRALLVDLLGFGFSGRPAAFSYSLEAHAETVARLIEHLGLRGCHLVGHSFGGSVAVVLAANRPDLIGGLIVAESNLDLEDATLSRMIADQTEEAYVAAGHTALVAQAEGWAIQDTVMASFPGTLRAADPQAMHRSATALAAGSLRELFFGLTLPRTYLFGASTLPHAHEALLRASGVPMVVIPDAGHAMMGENPDAVARAVAATLA